MALWVSVEHGIRYSGDTTGDVVTYEVGVPGKLIGLEIGAMRTTGVGTCGTNGSCAADCNSGRIMTPLTGHHPGHSFLGRNGHILTG